MISFITFDMTKNPGIPPSVQHLESLSRLMDSKFRIPGTEIRFGLDAVVGLIPGVGDFSTFLVSGYIMMTLAKNDASGFVIARMALNVLIDTLFGAIPVLGDIFDVAFKANQRNVKLMRQHYVEGRHRGGAWKVVFLFLIILLALMTLIIWGIYRLVTWIF